MANIPTKTFAQYVTDQVTYIQSAANTLIDFAIGSILRAIVESNSGVALWFQGLLLQLLAKIRAATSSGADLDSWCADFNFYRLPSVQASGQVTFARFTTGLAAFIPVGTQIQTSDASPEIFQVVADSNNANWNATRQGYDIGAVTGSISVPVLCSTGGALGNVQAGQCNVLTQSIPGVDTVTNPLAFVNGQDAESDDAFRARFRVYINGLSKATKNALGAAIISVAQNVDYTITENQTYGGITQYGYFFVVADDGSGTPGADFLSSISNAIEATRGFTISYGVFAPVVVTANVVMTVSVAAGYDAATVKTEVQAAVNLYLSGLKLGDDVPYTRLAKVAYDASPGVTNVTGVTLNAGTADLAIDDKSLARPGTITVN